MSEPAPSGRVALALGLLYLIWGTTFFGIRVALEAFPPLLLSGTRFTAAGALLYAVVRLRGAPRPTARQWGSAALVGGLLVGANVLVGFAEQSVSTGLAAVVAASTPLWAALVAGLWGEWPRRAEWVGLGVGTAGVVLLQSGGALRASPGGAVVLLASAWCWALGSMWSRRLPMPVGLVSPAAQMLVGGIIFLGWSLARGERPLPGMGWRPAVAWCYLLVFGSLVGYVSFNWLLRHVRPALATSYAYVNPAVALGLGVLAGEVIGPRAVGALALILGGVALVAFSRRARAA